MINLYIFAIFCFVSAIILAVIIANFEEQPKHKTSTEMSNSEENISEMLNNLYIVNEADFNI